MTPNKNATCMGCKKDLIDSLHCDCGVTGVHIDDSPQPDLEEKIAELTYPYDISPREEALLIADIKDLVNAQRKDLLDEVNSLKAEISELGEKIEEYESKIG